MNAGGDAAEQVVRLSLEGFEVAVRLSGSASKNIAVLLAAALKQEQKTKGKARLSNMIKSGKELKVFSIQYRDLKKFTQQAGHYGVLYCVLKNKFNKADNAVVDIIARAEDASKIERICDRFNLGGKVQDVNIVAEAEKDKAERETTAREMPIKSRADKIMEEITGKPIQKDGGVSENPTAAKTDKDNPLRRNYGGIDTQFDKGGIKPQQEKPSVKKELERCRQKAAEQKAAEQKAAEQTQEQIPVGSRNNQTKHEQPRQKKKWQKKDKNKTKGR